MSQNIPAGITNQIAAVRQETCNSVRRHMEAESARNAPSAGSGFDTVERQAVVQTRADIDAIKTNLLNVEAAIINIRADRSRPSDDPIDQNPNGRLWNSNKTPHH